MENIEIEKKQTEDDIEIEENDNIIINVPFNPNAIKVTTQPLTMGDLIERLEHGEVQIYTEFQRLPNLWNDTKKSRLIESLLLRLPIPTFYFDGQDDNKWLVIDGLQRISTLKSFVLDKTLVLKDLEFLTEFNTKTFDDLPRNLQRRIKTFPITVYILEKGTPDEVKYNIFSRINQGGLVLKPQEIRNALHQGIAANFISDLVRGIDAKDEKGNILKRGLPNGENILLEATETGKTFVRVTEGKIKTERMEDRDFATRFVAFYLITYEKYEPDLDTFMNKGMAAIKALTDKEREELKSNFQKALETAFTIFENDAFRKRFKEGEPRKPINKALFEVLCVNLAKQNDEQRVLLIERKEIFKSKLMGLMNNPDGKFLRAITQGTAQKETVEKRFEDIQLIIKETLQL